MKKYFLCSLAAISAALILLALMIWAGVSSDTVVIGKLPDPAATAAEFFEALAEGDYTRAMTYVDNYDSLGFETESTELVETFKKALTESYTAEPVEEGSAVHGLDAVQMLRVTYLDSRALFADAGERASGAAMAYKQITGSIDSDEQAMAFVSDALTECLAQPESYYKTEDIFVWLIFDGSEWKIVIDDELMRIIYGNFGSAISEGGIVNE